MNPNINTQPDQTSDSLEALTGATHFWHGTGRYQYDQEGRVVDVLEQIVDDGGLIPHEDGFDVIAHQMQSTSLARDRLYGRLYADMHLVDPMSAERGVTQQELFNTYLKGTEKAVIREYYRESGSALKVLRMMRDARKKLVKNGRWSRKVNSAEPPIKKVFTQGSDIPDNYPILIGISTIGAQAQTAGYVAKHEVRTLEPILFDQMTHIEVPEVKVDVTRTYLEGREVRVPVVAIEMAERG